MNVLGDQVIIPPPQDFTKVQKRMEEVEQCSVQYLDWWICNKSFGEIAPQGKSSMLVEGNSTSILLFAFFIKEASG